MLTTPNLMAVPTGMSIAPFQIEVTSAANADNGGIYTYTLDKGDSAGPSACVALGTVTSASPGLLSLRDLPSTPSVSYTTAGVKTAVVRVYLASACSVGNNPGTADVKAVGLASITVSMH